MRPHRLYTVEAMRKADEWAVKLGYPSLLLMEAAGLKVAQAALSFKPKRVVVLAGKGNNGGDGLAAARHLLGKLPVEVYAAEGQEGDAGLMRRALEAHGVEPLPLEKTQWKGGDLVIDALFGTGLKGPLGGMYAELVERLNRGSFVLSVDLPSGLPYEPHVPAQATVALGGLKEVHLFYPHRQACGRIFLAGIGLPPRALEDETLPEILLPETLPPFPHRPKDAHKGRSGRVGILGGFLGEGLAYGGAVALAALGAYRMGAGLVHLVYPKGLPLFPPLEAVLHPVASPTLPAARLDALAVGMGGGGWGKAWALAALEAGLPTVLDADALSLEVAQAYRERGIPALLTPHAGEAARLLGKPAEEVARSPLASAQALARITGLTVVLKGAPTVVAEGDRLAVNPTGGPSLATGGTGDVLAGALAALLAKGLSPWEAARLGVFLHGLAGDLLEEGALAHEVAEALPRARERLETGEASLFFEVI
ncbi:MAG: NAD(P)H-hydrate dehydratase [Thermaceae bacterium]